MTTTMTVTQSTRTNLIITSVMWLNAKTTKVPLSIYNVPSARIQETPNSPMPKPWPKPQGRERTPTPVYKILPMDQQPATLPKNHSHCNICHTASNVHSSKRSNSMAQYCSGISKPIYCQILAILPNKDDSQILATQKIVESDPSKTENSPRKTIIPHPAPLVSGNFITPSGPATANIVATSKFQEKKWEPSCQCCAQSTSHSEQDWSEEDWDGEKQKAKQKEKKKN